MATDPAKLAEFDQVLAKWKESFKAKASVHCPNKEEHEETFDLVDMKFDGWTSFTYRVTACCKAFEILVLQAATEERMFNPPRFNTGAPVLQYETEKDHRSGAVADREVGRHVEKEHYSSGAADATRSSVERCFEEIWNEHERAKIKEWVSPDCKAHSLDGSFTVGVGAFEEQFGKLFEAVPDLHVEVKYHVVEHDKAASLLLVTGTEGSSKQCFEYSAMTFSRWKDGKMVEAWNFADLDSLLLKMRGLLPVA